MKLNNTKFTIIIPTYNAENEIIKTIDSVLEQNFDDFECIIVDGKSIDYTIDIVKQYANIDNRIKYYVEADKGIYDAMNHGINYAKGEYCIFLGAGDILHDALVLDKLNIVCLKEKADIICGYVETNEGNTIIKSFPNWKYTFQFIPICHQAVCAKIDLLKQRPFNLNYKVGADQDWLMNMKKLHKKFVYINYPIAFYMLNGTSNSEQGKNIFKIEKKKIHISYFPIRFYLFHFYKFIKKSIIGED